MPMDSRYWRNVIEGRSSGWLCGMGTPLSVLQPVRE